MNCADTTPSQLRMLTSGSIPGRTEQRGRPMLTFHRCHQRPAPFPGHLLSGGWLGVRSGGFSNAAPCATRPRSLNLLGFSELAAVNQQLSKCFSFLSSTVHEHCWMHYSHSDHVANNRIGLSRGLPLCSGCLYPHEKNCPSTRDEPSQLTFYVT